MTAPQSPSRAYQWCCISRYVKDADHAISPNPISASIPANSRAGPNGAMSPYPNEVYVTSEDLSSRIGFRALTGRRLVGRLPSRYLGRSKCGGSCFRPAREKSESPSSDWQRWRSNSGYSYIESIEDEHGNLFLRGWRYGSLYKITPMVDSQLVNNRPRNQFMRRSRSVATLPVPRRLIEPRPHQTWGEMKTDSSRWLSRSSDYKH